MELRAFGDVGRALSVLPGGNPATAKNEQGCWVIYNTKTDTLRSVRFVMSNSRDSCAPGAPPVGGIAWYGPTLPD